MSEIPVSARGRLISLSKEKMELLKLLREEESRQTSKLRPYPRGDSIDGVRLPTSWAQQRLWFVDQLEEGRAGYQVLVPMRLWGSLDQEALQKALDTLVQRHEVLRTVFVSAQGDLKQEIMAEGCFALKVIDLSGYEATEREAQVRLHKVDEVHGRFDLRRGPVVRGRLLRLQSEEHVLLVTMHHIICDGWSKGVLIREIAELYTAYREGRGDALMPLAIQYADYAQWQRQQWMPGKALAKQLNYWCARLEGATPQLELPTDRPRPEAQSHRGGNVRVVLDAELSARLRIFAQRHEMTLFMVLYAGWAILLSRLSGQEDVVIGTPIANRQRPELEGLIGLFVNTLVLRVGVQGDLRMEEFLEQVKEVTLGAYDHQGIPFEKIVEALQPQRSLNRNPIFQVVFVLHNEPRSELRVPGLTVAMEDEVDEPSILDLWLSLEERGEEIAGSVNYAQDLFDRETVERWMESFTVLLRRMTDEVESRVGDLPILTESARDQVIKSFNVTQAACLKEKLIHELFEEQAERTPNAIAVVYEGQALTYAELNCRANLLARYLKDRGVAPDQLVGICVERDLEMVVGLLGILKAGGAYVPLDPHYPPERLAYILRDAEPKVVLIQERLKERLPDTRAEVVVLDGDWNEIAEKITNKLDTEAQVLRSHHLAYVIYTSGSTGEPKGVMVEHRNVTRLFSATEQWFGFNERDVWTLFHSFAFDFSVWELWGALLYGGRVVVVPYLTTRSPQEFYRLLCEEGVTVLNQTPSAFAQLIAQERSAEGRHSLRVVIFGGEALELRTLRPWVARNGTERPQLVNMYGITETTVHVTFRALAEQEIASEPGSLIGKPIPDLRIYLLDRYRQPVPIGVAGEIYVGGAGVARGYLNRPDLTAERFIADPFSGDSQSRLYKSGDLARWRADGTLEYLGRNDHQVKLRGFRVELGEIEGQLVRHAQVKDAVVIVREDTSGEKRLIAYVVPKGLTPGAMTPSVEALRAHLKSVLPEYMLPSAFVMLQNLPLTSNGKLDRNALPAPEFGAYVTRQHEAPQGEVEEILAGIWQSLLQVERVGRQDNFFELGGHSLFIVQMIERLQRVGLSAEVRRVFESSTLADMASTLTSEAAGEFEMPPNLISAECEAITPQMLTLVELEPDQIDRIVQSVPGGVRNVQDIYPLTPLQEGMLFHHLLNEQGGDAYARSRLWSLSSREKLEKLIRALQEVIDRHDILRTAILWEQLPQPVQVVCRRATLEVEELVLDRDRNPIEQLKERMRSERQRLDLRKAPLIRLQIATDLQGVQWYALLQTHHIASDNESLQILIAEVMAHIDGHAHSLPKPVPYRNQVAQTLVHARTHDAETFFRSKLGDIDEPTAPFGLSDVRGDGSRIGESCQALEPEMAKRIRVQARRLSVSAATLFHAVWGLVVAHTSGRDDVVFGSVLMGRLQGSAGAQRILGMFINTLPLRLRLHGLTARGLIEQTQRELVELLHHEQASLAVAQRCSGVAGSVPLFSTLLNYLHAGAKLGSEFSSAAGMELLATQGGTNYPIVLSADDQGEGFLLTAQTDRRIDSHRVIDYVQTAMRSLVEALEQESQAQALALAILPESERHQLIGSFNETRVTYPSEKLIHELFEEQVQRTPDAIAVVYEKQCLTYAELNGRANQLARYLRSQGVGPDQLVAICVERSVEMVVGLLGILKAGGAYVPLDPKYPAERLQYMLMNAAPRIVLTQQSVKKSLLPTVTEAVSLDGDWSEISQWDDGNLASRSLQLTPRHLAYVIYTSGSTGEPKGAMNEHRGVVNRLLWMQERYGLNCQDRVLQKTPFSFDVSVWEFFWTLLSGARLIVARPEGHRDPAYLRKLIEETGVTTLHFVPSMLQIFLDQHQAGGCPTVRHIVCSGEELSPALQNRCLECLPHACLSNLYGPTEAAVDVTAWECQLEQQGSRVPIGRPISNTQIYVLSRHGQPVPIGVAGEIYIGGVGVGRGYLNRPELTAERFVADPFSTDPQARLYRTGDLGLWRPDGVIEYLGRNDHQVKIRGVRIELGEIEAQLMRHKQVKEAVVVACEDGSGEKSLVAYITQRDHSGLNVEGLRAHLKAVLPESMVPSAFVCLESLPLTPNGKLDRRALPAPKFGAHASREYEVPQGETEESVARIWRELLRVERVGRQDNFFDIGGHSLLATRAITRIRDVLQVELPLVALFEAPTLEQLSLRVKAEGHGQMARATLRADNLARDLRQEISEMHDDAILARLAELEKELGHREGVMRDCVKQ